MDVSKLWLRSLCGKAHYEWRSSGRLKFCSRFCPRSWTVVEERNRFPISQQVLWWSFAGNSDVAGTDVTSQIMLSVRPKNGRG